MKKITDSLLKKILKQTLNENYTLLNEDDKVKKYDTGPIQYNGKKYKNLKVTTNPCPDGGFCFVKDISLWKAQQLGKKLSPVIGGRQGIAARGFELVKTLTENCNILQYGSANEDVVNKAVEDIGAQYAKTLTEEDKVKKIILSLNYPEWCKAIEVAKEKGFADDNFWTLTTVGSDDYSPYVANPSLEVLRKTIKQTEAKHTEFWESVSEAVNEDVKSQDDLLVKAKKCGHNTVDEYQKSGWKCEGPAYTIGGGGENSVSFSGYECISEHPALVNKQIKLPDGVGYKLNTNNPFIDSFIFGVTKNPDGTDKGTVMSETQKIPLDFSCDTNRLIKKSLSKNVWNYDGVLDGAVFGSNPGKIALTTDPDIEDDGKSNQTVQLENIKGFRYKLLTEVELKYVKGKLQTGPDVVAIQKKLGISTAGGYGTGTKKAVEKFQKDKGLPVTGDVDETTYKAIMAEPDPVVPSATGYTRELKIGVSGPDVVNVQTRLGISTKGGFGSNTESAVKSFQKKYKLPETGIVDQATFNKIMSVKPVGTPATYSGKKHNYKVGNWVKVTPEIADEQLNVNDGYFEIITVPNEYTIVIEAAFITSGTTGGSTQRVLFGEDAKQGTQEVIRGERSTGTSSRAEVETGTGKRSNVDTTVDTEKQKKINVRKKETCNTLREIKQYLNNTKGLSMTVNCKWNQEIRNQVMLALTGGSSAPAPSVEEPKSSTPGGNVTVY